MNKVKMFKDLGSNMKPLPTSITLYFQSKLKLLLLNLNKNKELIRIK